jgi:hypothetical protein
VAAYEILLLNTAIPQIQAAQSGDTYVVPRDIAFSAALTLSAGTANGVPYLNGSKVVTTGSALTFDGTNFATTGSGTLKNLLLTGGTLPGAGTPSISLRSSDNVVYHQSGSANTIVLLDSSQNTMQSIGATAQVWNISNIEQMRLNSSGLAIANGNLVMSTSGKGIDFSATSSGTGTMTSELLNDYEEGTWTPNYAGSTGSAGSYAVSDNSGWYTKVGNMVTVWWRLILTNKGSWTGDIEITGLPFTVANPSGTFDGANAIGVSKLTFSGYVYTEPRRNTTYISVLNVTSGSDVAILATTTVSNDSAFLGQATYFV